MSVGQEYSVVNQDGDGQEWNDNSSKVCPSTRVEILELELKNPSAQNSETSLYFFARGVFIPRDLVSVR